jgi:hypothetical protein
MAQQDKAIKLAMAIAKVESGGNYQAKGGSGESGAFQFMPSTWKGWAKQYLGDANAPLTKANQNQVAVKKVSDLLDKGYDERQVALSWNAGSPVEVKGVNKYGVKYDSGAYANKVISQYNSMKNTPTTTPTTIDKGIDNARKLGKTDTEILEYLKTKNSTLSKKIDELKIKAQQTGRSDREVLNFISKQTTGKEPTVPSVPIKVDEEAERTKVLTKMNAYTLLNPLAVPTVAGNAIYENVLKPGAKLVNKVYDVFSNLPGIKQAGQLVGSAVGAGFATTGGIGAALGEITKQSIKKATGQEYTKENIVPVFKSEVKKGFEFGKQTGQAAVPAVLAGGLGKVANTVLAFGLGHEGANELTTGLKEKDYEKAFAGALSLGASLMMAKGAFDKTGKSVDNKVADQLKSEINYLRQSTPESIIKKQTEIYRNVLKPTAGEIKNIEIKKGGNIDDSYDLMAREGVIIGKSADGKLDTTEAVNLIKSKFDEPSAEKSGILLSNNKEVFNLNETVDAVKKRITEKKLSAVEEEDMIKDLTDIINAEVKRKYGADWQEKGIQPKFSGMEVDKIKAGMWKMGYNMLRPTSNKVARLIGYELGQQLDDVYKNTKLKEYNDRMSKLATAMQLLENAHGRVIRGGQVGKALSGLIGTVVGSTINIPVVGPLLGKFGANAIYDLATNPERITTKASQKVQKAIETKKLPESILKKINEGQKIGLSIKDITKNVDQEDIEIMTNFIDNVRLLKGKEKSLELEVAGRKLAEDMGIYGDISNTKLANVFEEIITNTEGNFVVTPSKDFKTKSIKEIKPYKETGNLTTKILKDLEGKTTVSKQYILDATNRPELKQVERELIREALKTESDTINVAKFAEKVKRELLPLKLNKSGSKAGLDDNMPGGFSEQGDYRYESISLPDELRGNVANYSEHIWESPIKTSAGETHFSGASDNYFGHTRIEDMADMKPTKKWTIKELEKGIPRNLEEQRVRGYKSGGTRRVIEVQSDLYQKGNLEKETIPKNTETFSNRKMLEEKITDYNIQLKESTTDIRRNFLKEEISKFNNDLKLWKNKEQEVSKLSQYNDPTAHFRMVREEVKQAAIDGKTKLQFPTGETAMKIEGLGDVKTWTSKDGELLTPNTLKTGSEVRERGVDGNNWIITDVLGDGKFKAVPKERFDNWFNNPNDILNRINKTKETGRNDLLSQSDEIILRDEIYPSAEQFDISGKVDTSNPIYKFYEKDLGRYLTSKYKAKVITDKQGVKWYEIDVKPEYKKMPVEAFGLLPFLLFTNIASILQKKKEEK